ncbi:porin [Pseudomonas sp. F1_0610]|uniref:OprO/OprP family phosphate-selective porin n=1 Tax=Pseudomonas sp. F1_0610 TaxID=3114284 RepID=UPI0039C34B0C
MISNKLGLLRTLGFGFSALAMAVSTQAIAGNVITDGPDIKIKTKGGFEAKTVDDQFSFKIGGRIQADYGQFDGVYTKNGKTANEAYFRRAILELSGTAYQDWKYVFNLDFAEDGSSKWDEASIAYTGFPVTIKVGRFDPDFGLEKATSSKWITAIERSMIYDYASWVNDKDDGMGIQLSGTAADMFYASAGVNRPKGKEDANGKNKNTYNIRAVFAPMAEAGNVLHFGINYATRQKLDYDGSIKSRMGVRGTTEDKKNGHRPVFAKTGEYVDANGDKAFAFNKDSVWGLEAAYAYGPFSAQGEYISRKMGAKSGSGYKDRKVEAYNVQLAYTITGEARGYKLDGGKFDSIKPQNSYGAWEVFYRYDDAKVKKADLDTTTGEFYNTKARGHTLGVNWYANEAIRVSADYLKAKTDKHSANANDDRKGDAITMRLQYVF